MKTEEKGEKGYEGEVLKYHRSTGEPASVLLFPSCTFSVLVPVLNVCHRAYKSVDFLWENTWDLKH